MKSVVTRAHTLTGTVAVPGDKSVSHRALLLASLGDREVTIDNIAPGADVRSTARVLGQLGVKIELEGRRAKVFGVGLHGLKPSQAPLDCGNSGTTIRLMSGVVAGARIGGELDGDESLRRRPMRRVLEPLRKMGARAHGRALSGGDDSAPLVIEPGHTLSAIEYRSSVSSAQVKSAVLLAGLWADGTTRFQEPQPSRDHTERMLTSMRIPLVVEPDGTMVMTPPRQSPQLPELLGVPGDPSSAAFLLGAALLVPGSEVEVLGVDVNPHRMGFVRALERMGARIERTSMGESAGDPVAALRVRGGGELHATEIAPFEVPSLIDEIPILAVVATQARGRTVIRGARELRVKESDRLAQMAHGLTAMGAKVEELSDGLIIEGPCALAGAAIDAASDHRIAMSFTVAGLAASGTTTVSGAEWADISFPGFFGLLGEMSRGAVQVRE
jgi:3-phosphoshikimate 1-carboxyvinyltransferase